MGVLQLIQLERAGHNLRRLGPITIDPEAIVARAETDLYSVLYLRSGQKLIVQETLDEIDEAGLTAQRRRELTKRFKRELRECKAMRVPVDQAFAALWDDLSGRAALPEPELRGLYQELLDWTKRWLK